MITKQKSISHTNTHTHTHTPTPTPLFTHRPNQTLTPDQTQSPSTLGEMTTDHTQTHTNTHKHTRTHTHTHTQTHHPPTAIDTHPITSSLLPSSVARCQNDVRFLDRVCVCAQNTHSHTKPTTGATKTRIPQGQRRARRSEEPSSRTKRYTRSDDDARGKIDIISLCVCDVHGSGKTKEKRCVVGLVGFS